MGQDIKSNFDTRFLEGVHYTVLAKYGQLVTHNQG